MKQLNQVQTLKQQIKVLTEELKNISNENNELKNRIVELENALNNNVEMDQLRQQINDYEKNLALLDVELQSIIDELEVIINER